MFGVATPTRSPISRTAPTSASSSKARPCSASTSIEVLNAPSWRVTAMRASGVCSIGQPMRAPMAAASAMPRAMKARTSSSSRMASQAAPVSAETGFMVMLPQSLNQMSRRMFSLRSA